MNIPPSKLNKHYQTELAEKTSTLILLEMELQRLRQQVEDKEGVVKEKERSIA